MAVWNAVWREIGMVKPKACKETSLVEEVEKRGSHRVITEMLAVAVVRLMVLLNPSSILVCIVETAGSTAEQPGTAQVFCNVTRVFGRKRATGGTLATTLILHRVTRHASQEAIGAIVLRATQGPRGASALVDASPDSSRRSVRRVVLAGNVDQTQEEFAGNHHGAKVTDLAFGRGS